MVVGCRRIVDRRDQQRHCGRYGSCEVIADNKGKEIVPVSVRRRGIDQIGCDAAQHPLCRRSDNRISDDRVIVVTANQGDGDWCIFVRADGLLFPGRPIVDSVDGERNRCYLRGGNAVADDKGKVIVAAKLIRWRVDQIRADATHRPLLRLADNRIGKDAAIGVCPGQGNIKVGIFIGGDALRIGRGCVVPGQHGDGDRRCRGRRQAAGGNFRAIGHLEGQAVHTGKATIGRVDQVGGDAAQRATDRLCRHGISQRITLNVTAS